MKVVKINFLFFLFLTFLINVCLSQSLQVKPPVNKNLSFTLDVIEIKSKHFVIPHLKVFADTQDIKIHKEITYGNENDPIVACHFFIQKLVKNKLVNIYLNKLYYPEVSNLFEFKKFTTKDLLTDTICIEDLVPLEPGQYVVTLELNYYLNGSKEIINSDETIFFVTNESGKEKDNELSIPGMTGKD